MTCLNVMCDDSTVLTLHVEPFRLEILYITRTVTIFQLNLMIGVMRQFNPKYRCL